MDRSVLPQLERPQVIKQFIYNDVLGEYEHKTDQSSFYIKAYLLFNYP
jgi:hypothetical protein